MLLTAFFIMVLCVCTGLLVGCKDPFTPDDPEYTVTFYAESETPAYLFATTACGLQIISVERRKLKSLKE